MYLLLKEEHPKYMKPKLTGKEGEINNLTTGFGVQYPILNI